jgi:hypothetical protein
MPARLKMDLKSTPVPLSAQRLYTTTSKYPAGLKNKIKFTGSADYLYRRRESVKDEKKT